MRELFNKIKNGVLVFALMLSFGVVANAQNLCDDTRYAKADFNISATTICTPDVVTLSNLTAGTGYSFVYDYKGEPWDYVYKKGTASLQNQYTTIDRPAELTILFMGVNANKEKMVGCRNIIVKPSTKPVFSYQVCSNNAVELVIPQHKLNDYDTYSIDFGPGIAVKNITKADLPYTEKATYTLPRTLKINGGYNNFSKNCPNADAGTQVKPVVYSLTGPGSYQEFNANMTKLEMTSPNRVKLTFDGPYVTNPTYEFKLFQYIKGNPANTATSLINNLIPGTYEIKNLDSTKAYCFYASRKDACSIGNERTAELCTHPLQPAIFSPIKNNLFWTKYPQLLFGSPSFFFFGAEYNNSQEIIRTENGLETAISIQKDRISYTDNSINCTKRYCYRIKQTTWGKYDYMQFRGESYSNERCVDRSEVHPPQIEDAYVSSDADKNVVTFTNNVTWYLPFKRNFLYKEVNNKTVVVDSVDATVFSISDNNYLGNAVKALEKPEKYWVTFKDICNSESELSPMVESVFLKAEAGERVTWSSGNPYSMSTPSTYELIPLDETTKVAQAAVLMSAGQFTFGPDLDRFEENAFFKIKVTPADGSGKVSYSNVLSFPIVSQIVLPNVFTPNGDGYNDLLVFKGKTKKFTSFEFELYDRFGALIYQNKDKNASWDGKVNGRPLAAGVYFYKFKADVAGASSIYTTSGSLEIMR
ncbi:gliding motility-associated C-terminal domain-containing protein [Lacihabitans lacunae]|uniref:Gliding motility-associated C-terminal domain-containing protein n=1 Tax=Lacihabitans lacunae TaxID=1028214 RepID=A0ABV7YYU4_9BACT